MTYQYIRFFNEIGIDDISEVGGKNASLGEMYQKLVTQGIKVPQWLCDYCSGLPLYSQ